MLFALKRIIYDSFGGDLEEGKSGGSIVLILIRVQE